jgi:LysM repeat protein
MPRYLTAPTRFLVIISTFVVALLLLLASSVMAAGPEPATADYTVRSGDTLWNIASEVVADGDVRDTVAQIRHMNDLDSSVIHAGQVLVLPASHTM